MPSTSKWPVVQTSDMGLPPAFPAKCRSTFTLCPPGSSPQADCPLPDGQTRRARRGPLVPLGRN